MGTKDEFQEGFTLIELLVTIAVLGVLSAAVLVVIDPGARLAAARDAQRKSDLRQIANALDAYYVENEEYPCACDRSQSEGGCSSANSSSWYVGDSSAVLDVLINEGYLRVLPSDPVNTGFSSVWDSSVLSYFYVSEDVGLRGDNDAVAGEYYMLGTFLEGANDPLTLDNLGSSDNDRPDWPNCLPEEEDDQNIGFDGRILLIRSYRCDTDPEGSL